MTVQAPSTAVESVVFACGPASLRVACHDAALLGLLEQHLAQFDTLWREPHTVLDLEILGAGGQGIGERTAAAYMRSRHLQVDRDGLRLRSVGYQGTELVIEEESSRARLCVPDYRQRPTLIEEAEQQITLLATRAWQRAGWAPVHAATVMPPGEDRAILIGAPSGSGKTTLVATLLRRGWCALGDDKALVRVDAGVAVARALTARTHLHPSASTWLPEAGNIARWPRYSPFTEKRSVPMGAVWPRAHRERAQPAAMVQLRRDRAVAGLSLRLLDQPGTVQAMLEQVALPSDAEHARPLVRTCAAACGTMRGGALSIGEGAYDDPGFAEQLEAALRGLVS